MFKTPRQRVDCGYDLVALCHRQRAAGAEVVLQVDNQQRVRRRVEQHLEFDANSAAFRWLFLYARVIRRQAVISRVTLFSLLLGLMLGAGIRLWDARQKDNCSLYMAGDKTLSASQMVVSGTRQIVVPCNDWIMRQPMRVQILCLLDFVLLVVFFLNALADLQRSLRSRSRMRG